jgi:hypothetical protein
MVDSDRFQEIWDLEAKVTQMQHELITKASEWKLKIALGQLNETGQNLKMCDGGCIAVSPAPPCSGCCIKNSPA